MRAEQKRGNKERRIMKVEERKERERERESNGMAENRERSKGEYISGKFSSSVYDPKSSWKQVS